MGKTKTFSLLSAISLLSLTSVHSAQAFEDHLRFKMVPSGGVSECLPHARAKVTVYPGENAEIMTIRAKGLPPETAFDFFITQLPNPPFGLSWYQGDIETNSRGYAKAIFIGRFNKETFIVAPGVGEAPLTHEDGTFPDAEENPATGPVHTYHLGLWFNSPQDAMEAGCPGTTTPFNGDHDAGIQVLSTRNFEDTAGPLVELEP